MQTLEHNIGYVFRNKALLRRALTHRSYVNEHRSFQAQHNERLEFLGDAVLDLVVTDYIFRTQPNRREGDLTVIRSALVNNEKVAEVAESLGVNEFLFLSRGEAKNISSRKFILANTFEAIIGAIYIDGGFELASRFIHRVHLSTISPDAFTGDLRDPKTRLQETLYTLGKQVPRYEVLNVSGSHNERKTKVGVYVDNQLIAEGSGPSRAKAELAAATEAQRHYC